MDAFIQELVNQFYSVFSLNYDFFRTGFALLCMLAFLLFSCSVFAAIVFGIVETLRGKILDVKNGNHEKGD